MTKEWKYNPGDWNLICDVCAKKIKASEAKHRWDGLIVCKEDWEPRHNLDFIRSYADKISVPFSRPEPKDSFILQTPFTDMFRMFDGPGQNYISDDYFAEDYIQGSFFITVDFGPTLTDSFNLSDVPSFTLLTPISDSFGFTDASTIMSGLNFQENVQVEDEGFVLLENYVEAGYFEELYVGDLRLIT